MRSIFQLADAMLSGGSKAAKMAKKEKIKVTSEDKRLEVQI